MREAVATAIGTSPRYQHEQNRPLTQRAPSLKHAEHSHGN